MEYINTFIMTVGMLKNVSNECDAIFFSDSCLGVAAYQDTNHRLRTRELFPFRQIIFLYNYQ